MAQTTDQRALDQQTQAAIESADLKQVGKLNIDDVIEYVHTGLRLPNELELYARYLKQRWDVYELDFTQDAIDWREKMTEPEHESFIGVSAGFHHGERQVEVDLVPFMLGGTDEEKIFISSQIEDEARHTVFFDRFYRDVVGLPGETIFDVLDNSYPWVSEMFAGPFGLLAYQADFLTRDPENPHLRVQYATNYMLWIEGVLALTVMKLTLGYCRNRGFLPAYYTGFTATTRDESRHVQFGMQFLAKAVRRDPTMERDIHAVIETLFNMSTARSRELYLEPLGFTNEYIRDFQIQQLTRKLNAIGLDLPERVKANLDKMEAQVAGG